MKHKDCPHFPCHKGIDEADFCCDYCYCPFYPCKVEQFGGYWKTVKTGKVWACDKCTWIHDKRVVDVMIKAAGQTLKKIMEKRG